MLVVLTWEMVTIDKANQTNMDRVVEQLLMVDSLVVVLVEQMVVHLQEEVEMVW